MKLGNMMLKLGVAGFAGMALFVVPAVSAPISVFPKNLAQAASVDESAIVQVRGRGGYRGGAARGGAAYRGGAVARGGAVVRGGTVVRRGGVYYGGGYCNPNYQYCGSSAYSSGGVYRGGAVVRGGGYARGGAVVRAGGARGAHVAHRGGGGGRRR